MSPLSPFLSLYQPFFSSSSRFAFSPLTTRLPSFRRISPSAVPPPPTLLSISISVRLSRACVCVFNTHFYQRPTVKTRLSHPKRLRWSQQTRAQPGKSINAAEDLSRAGINSGAAVTFSLVPAS